MNPVNPQRRELLDELFSESNSLRLDGVLAAIHREKLRRASRQRALTLAASVAVLVAVAMVGSRLRERAPHAQTTERMGIERRTPALAEMPFAVERLDDEGLLDLLDQTPAALVHWPNGKRDLMVLVQMAAPD